MTTQFDQGRPMDGGGAFGRPTIGAAAAAKQVAEDASALVRAEIALAKAEVMDGVKAKAVGAGLVAAAGAIAAIAMLWALVVIAFVLHEVAGMTGWGATLTVTVALLLLATVLGLVGRSKLATEVQIDTTKRNVEQDVAHTKERLGR